MAPPGMGAPGFLPPGLPESILPNAVVGKTPSRIVPTSAPFTPSFLLPHVTQPLDSALAPLTPTQKTSKAPQTSTAQAKQDVKAFAGSSGLSKTIASHAPSAGLQSEDFPALESAKVKPISVVSSLKPLPPVKTLSLASTSKKSVASLTNIASTSQPVAKASEKRSIPGVLNIVTSPAKMDTAEKSNTISSSFPPLPPSTPSVSTNPLPRPIATALKGAKSLPTPKTEIPTAATTSSTISMFTSNYHATRQASLASASKMERSGTPTSEIISDNASITSASISRANSPPPSKVGSAPVRVSTKSMQKKQRKQVRTENLEQELEAAITKPEPEPEIAPIMGRKKKQKKERTVSGAAGESTPAASRPSSPGPRTDSIQEENFADVARQHDIAPQQQEPEKVLQSPSKHTPETKPKSKATAQPPPSPEPVSALTDAGEEPPEKAIPTPASILQDLVSEGIIDDIANLNFLKLPSLSSRHQEISSDLLNAIPKLTITPEDQAALLAGKLVRKNVEGPNRILLTPNGDCVRNLTQEEEDQFLALQASIAEEYGPAAFFSAKHHTANGFTLVGGRAVPNGPPAFFPQSEGNVDPVAKIQRDEALSYINQYVLPSLHTNSQLEKALNANALDTETLRANDSAAWASWASDPAVPPPENGVSGFPATHEGILSSGLQSITAHFGIGRDVDRGQPLGNVSMLSLTDAENAMQIARKETEGLEKRLNALLKKNKRLLLGSGH